MLDLSRRVATSERLRVLAEANPYPCGTRTDAGATGCLVVYSNETWLNRGIWAERRKGRVATDDRVIASVKAWEIEGTLILAAVFPHLRVGAYRILEGNYGKVGRAAEVLVEPGKIVSLDWS